MHFEGKGGGKIDYEASSIYNSVMLQTVVQFHLFKENILYCAEQILNGKTFFCILFSQ